MCTQTQIVYTTILSIFEKICVNGFFFVGVSFLLNKILIYTTSIEKDGNHINKRDITGFLFSISCSWLEIIYLFPPSLYREDTKNKFFFVEPLRFLSGRGQYRTYIFNETFRWDQTPLLEWIFLCVLMGFF